MIKYLVEVLVALPDKTWFTLEQVIETDRPGRSVGYAIGAAQQRTENELHERGIEYALTTIYHYEVLGEETP